MLARPLPPGAADRLRWTAGGSGAAGAAVMILQPHRTPEGLLRELTRLLMNHAVLAEMGASARKLAHPGALEKIAAMVLSLAV